ncbi:MAG: sulfotransferase domain-containing protein [Cytophagales bacterium]|nr:sulfotransferase domain-containing protein [Cytophagales bacterium]
MDEIAVPPEPVPHIHWLFFITKAFKLILKHLIPRLIRSWIRHSAFNAERRIRLLTASSRKLPDFFCVGAQKSGSSTLYWWLRQHPQLGMSFDKESKFLDRYYSKGEKWYRHQFPLASSKKLAGDNTPYYLFHPLVPERAYSLCPEAKIIVILRNPINRAFSQYQMECRKGREVHNSFEEAIEGEMERIHEAKTDLLSNPLDYHHTFENTSYLSRGIYIDQIEHWLKWYKRDQILILISETFFADPRKELKKVYDFLSISQTLPNDFTPYNVADYENMNEKTRLNLRDFFRPHNERLEEFLDRKLDWN